MSRAEQGNPTFAGARPVWQRMLCRSSDRIIRGRLTLRFEDGCEHVAVGTASGPAAVLNVRRPRALLRLITGGTLGFARAYIDGDIDSPDIGVALELAVANEKAFSRLMAPSALIGGIARLRHRLRRNSVKGSRRNISFHYDLGNTFYKLWLDRTMTYSSALFDDHTQSLTEAQEAKYTRIIRELGIGPNDHVLEIGCGWGGFAEHAIRTTGCRVTGLTLSIEQARFARERLERAGLADHADIRLEDYRHCQGQFDKIVSIEMFEAVGEENWPVYFQTVRDRLKPGGRAVVQSITIHENRFESYRRNADFIQTYIFPGGMLPSLEAFSDGARKAGLDVSHMLDFGRDYDRTLIAWDQAFVANWPDIEALGFDRHFYRLWRFYLHYCAVGFRTGRINVAQFRLDKPV
ncbi:MULTISPECIES: SAM-dependent methyltransferase [Alphaproteobacteria]|uniref:Cyclopropane-fatty-acyl-phospholipid synthase n=2 Tax=Alphaproteobacteria TaxID=28211 RepID=A0A512HIP8_9HYPH|nr:MULTISPECIES: cyclopropane-fatty-acyl-phospholipid synthase family protein [Alphaproteobacteria]GEO85302.1 cyclopropane-fatty-acyl-phospholipid synthase [Ciceribacter naphthalenivorans]GLR20941.1 cyclopropane-fatty-acyl-phospholipid synthase [Ciceribacter naphthalenivorans]GLT03797.1 cyclopropane-fatty-acyl-phospholipid synthase [Sphingomonas psychrolutea]